VANSRAARTSQPCSIASVYEHTLHRTGIGSANSNPDGAYKVHSEIKTAISRLEAFPFIGRVTDRPGVRVLAVVRYPYKVFYRVYDDGDVLILRVMHTAQGS